MAPRGHDKRLGLLATKDEPLPSKGCLAPLGVALHQARRGKIAALLEVRAADVVEIPHAAKASPCPEAKAAGSGTET